jgi:hypothetical protein
VLDGGGYVSLGRDRWVLLAPPRAPAGPLSLRVASLPPLVAGTPARVVDGGLEIGDRCVALDGVRVVLRPRPQPGAGRPQAPVRVSPFGPRASVRVSPFGPQASVRVSPFGPQAPVRVSPPGPQAPVRVSPPPAELRDGVEALSRGRLRAAVRLLAGRGDGLTPAGDDVLAGYAGWKASTGVPVGVADAAAARTTSLSAAYLRCAERGELPEAAEALIAALHVGDAAAVRRTAARLAGWGATSGRAIMLGIAVAGAEARTGPPRPAPEPGSAPAGPSPPR